MTVVHLAPLDFSAARISGLKPVPFEKGLFEGSGSLESAAIEADAPFDRLVGSFNADIPPGAAVEMQAQARAAGRWTAWYGLSRWEAKSARSLGRQEDSSGFVDIDTLNLKAKADAFRYRLLLKGAGRKPSLRRVAVSVIDSSRALAPAPPFTPGPWVRELKIRGRSQMTEEASHRKDLCSPTSLAMAMEFWGLRLKTGQVAEAVLDHAHDGVYGNWTLNMAAASTLGLAAQIAWLDSLKDLEREIAEGRPVVASITFKEGELTGAPIKRTKGHLLVVAGFTSDGDVIAYDPAAPDAAQARRVYRRGEFENVWLAHKHGAAYLLSRRFPQEFSIAAPSAELRLRPRAPAKPKPSDKERASELLSGERVRAVRASGNWVLVESEDQPHWDGKSWRGYPGWVQAQALAAPLPRTAPPQAEAQARQIVLDTAARFLGQPYVWGGLSSPQSPQGIDCSGLTHVAYRSAGVVIPRDAQDQQLKARPLRTSELRPGDLIFLSAGEKNRRINHVMLYAGGDDFLESRDSANGVLKTTFVDRFLVPLGKIESGGVVLDMAAKKPKRRRVFFGSFLP